MKKILIPILALAVTLGLSLPALASSPVLVASTTVDLIMDGGDTCTDIGDVTIDYYESVGDSDGYFVVSYAITDPDIVSLDETHVYLASTPPQKHSPGKFPYEQGDMILLDVDEGGTVCIAAHAEVTWDTGLVDGLGDPIYESETGWAQSGDDTGIGRARNWATYFSWIPIPAP